jgi:hypothetical protein
MAKRNDAKNTPKKTTTPERLAEVLGAPSTSTEGQATPAPAAPAGRAAKDERRRLLAAIEDLKADTALPRARRAVAEARDKVARLISDQERARGEANSRLAQAETELWDAEQKRDREISRLERELAAVTPA